MACHWYYAKGNAKHGPLSENDIRRLADSGELQPDDLVWKTGMADWQPARTVEGLFPESPAITTLPPPPPIHVEPQGQLAQTFDVVQVAKDLFAVAVAKVEDVTAKATVDAAVNAKKLKKRGGPATNEPHDEGKGRASDEFKNDGTDTPSNEPETYLASSKPVPKWAMWTVGSCVAPLLLCCLCGIPIALIHSWIGPPVKVSDGKGSTELEVMDTYSVESAGRKVAITVFKIAARYDSIETLDVKVRITSTGGFTDEHGKDTVYELEMGHVEVVDTWLQEARKYKDADTYANRQTGLYVTELRRLKYVNLLNRGVFDF